MPTLPPETPFTSDDSARTLLRELREREKELECLYAVENLTSEPDLPLQQIIDGVVAAVPAGWQYPAECQARIRVGKLVAETPDYRETQWTQVAKIQAQGAVQGIIEVSYRSSLPSADEGPFLKQERRLIETIADRISNCLTHRKLLADMQEWRNAESRLVAQGTPEWRVILDLLARTDQGLLLRLARKMLNHLRRTGVREADTLFRHFGDPAEPDGDPRIDRNRPLIREVPATPATVVNCAFELAASHLSQEEVVRNIHRWIRHDRATYLVDALENDRTPLIEVADAIDRYLHASGSEADLGPAVMRGLRASLIRRLLTDQLDYLSIARDYLDISDLRDLIRDVTTRSEGGGRIGGKAAGILLARRIVERHACANPLLKNIRAPQSWHVASDALDQFIHDNHLEDVLAQKYKNIEEVRQEYPDIIQLFKNSHFSPKLVRGFSALLDQAGDCPLIVRSSSLLEDRVGAAFSGKYKSLFLANQGERNERLAALLDAVAEVYASVLGPDPIEYRVTRNLIDYQEGMGILVQKVVGRKVGDYYLPLAAGVAFSRNEFRWSPRIAREDGLIRLVFGLGTRAVDRVGDDFPILVAPGKPNLRANATTDEIVRYSPRFLDLIDLKRNRFETVPVADFLANAGCDLPHIELLLSSLEHGMFRTPLADQLNPAAGEWVVTADGLLNRTPFVAQIRELLTVLERELNTPVDIEFAHDGEHLYLLQCRAQSAICGNAPAPIPRDIAHQRIVFTARRFVSNGAISSVTHIVYVDPERYASLTNMDALTAVGRAVGRLNTLLPKRRFILMGPGRWGSRGDIKLGVRVTYSDINNTALLTEIARRNGQYTPDLSFGTHFFQDLIEAGIRYLPLYPDDEDVRFDELFLTRSPNILAGLLPEFAALADVIRVIDVPACADGQVLRVLMNGELDEAIAFLTPPEEIAELPQATENMIEPAHHQFWRWRMRMAEKIAAQVDSKRYGVVAMYIFGSTETGCAGPGSDIDLLVHLRGNEAQRVGLEQWLDGWSRALAEMNYLRTGYETDTLLDVHIVTDDDIARKSSFAAKIGAITDPARRLTLGGSSPCRE